MEMTSNPIFQVIDRNIVFFCLLKKSISKDKFHWGSRGDKQYKYMIVDMNFKIFLTKRLTTFRSQPFLRIRGHLKIPICHQFLTSQLDDFFFTVHRAGSDDVVNEDFLLLRGCDVDEADEGTKNIYFRFYERCEVGGRSARSIVIAH
jgi:hypothetical protein